MFPNMNSHVMLWETLLQAYSIQLIQFSVAVYVLSNNHYNVCVSNRLMFVRKHV